MIARHGYGILLLVPRGQGESEGDPVRWAGDTDLIAGAEYLQGRPDVEDDRIGAIGFSVGGEQLLEAAARSPAIKAVVSEGAGGRVGEADGASGPLAPLLDLSMHVMTASATVFQNTGPHPRPEERIGLIAPRPVSLIYAVPGMGEEDIRQPQFFAAAGEPKQIWRVPGSSHTGGIDAQPAEYERRVIDFLDRSLLATDERSTP
jgi:pimeloyl-ACP methyl ester carboxylesterase